MPKAHNETIKQLEQIAVKIREDIIKTLLEAGSGHSAGSLGTADIFTALYFNILNIDPKNPNDEGRDRFVLSNGHICPVLYTTLAHRGFFDKKELKTLRKLGSKLQGHPVAHFLPGIEVTSGPLGMGLGQAIGIAIAGKMNGGTYRVYCMTGDGELDEGGIWESAMFAAHNSINNLTWIIDRNSIQQDGFTEDILKIEPLREKLEAFGWYVIEIDGHNMEEIISSANLAKAIFNRPTAIIAHTIPGKGVSFMEYKFEWHGKPPDKKGAQVALEQLRTLEGRIKSEHD